MKNAVFIRSSNIYSDSRATKEIAALLEAGFHVIALGWNRNGRADVAVKEIFDSKNIEFRFFDVVLTRDVIGKRLDILVRWIYWVYKTLSTIRDISFVHVCDLDAGLGAYYYCKRRNIPFIYDIYDYYIDSHSIPRFMRSIVESLEKEIIEFANTTIICTEERREQIKDVTPKNLMIIHNSPDVEYIPHGDSDFIDYAYCGSLGNGRLLREIMEEYENHSQLKFTFAGYGTFQLIAKRLANNYQNFNYLGEISYKQVLETEAKALVITAIYEPTIRNHRLCAPNKFYEALALGKPIIVCKGTGIDKIVEREKIGFVIGYSAIDFYKVVRYIKNNEDICKEMGKKARKIYIEKYSWKLMKTKLIKVYQELV